MILSTYNPNGQASCPTCKKLQKVYITGGLLIGPEQYMDSRCLTCETEFRIFVFQGPFEKKGTVILKQGSGGMLVG
jgi:hypothetical protein